MDIKQTIYNLWKQKKTCVNTAETWLEMGKIAQINSRGVNTSWFCWEQRWFWRLTASGGKDLCYRSLVHLGCRHASAELLWHSFTTRGTTQQNHIQRIEIQLTHSFFCLLSQRRERQSHWPQEERIQVKTTPAAGNVINTSRNLQKLFKALHFFHMKSVHMAPKLWTLLLLSISFHQLCSFPVAFVEKPRHIMMLPNLF